MPKLLTINLPKNTEKLSKNLTALLFQRQNALQKARAERQQ